MRSCYWKERLIPFKAFQPTSPGVPISVLGGADGVLTVLLKLASGFRLVNAGESLVRNSETCVAALVKWLLMLPSYLTWKSVHMLGVSRHTVISPEPCWVTQMTQCVSAAPLSRFSSCIITLSQSNKMGLFLCKCKSVIEVCDQYERSLHVHVFLSKFPPLHWFVFPL